jgi:FMN-dependent NADH-azoreductase
MKLLRIDSSARRNSVSRQLTSRFVETWKKENPKGEVIERDLATTRLPLITDEWTLARLLGPSQPQHFSEARARAFEHDGGRAAGCRHDCDWRAHPQLCAFRSVESMDRPGRPRGSDGFFNPNGPQGLLAGKKAVVITSRGGSYRAGTPTAQYDYQQPYLRHILAFVGLTDATFIHAENQKPGGTWGILAGSRDCSNSRACGRAPGGAAQVKLGSRLSATFAVSEVSGYGKPATR